jgi:Uma2 family endonuclease
VTLPQPGHLLSLAEWDSLPDDPSQRFELSEGVLVVIAKPSMRHQRVGRRLATLLEDQLPLEWTVETDVAVVCEAGFPPTVRAPDVIVVPTGVDDALRLPASDVLLAVEVLSPTTRGTDQVLKFRQYADAGIANYWLINTEPPLTLTAYTLVDGEYELVAEGSGKLHLLSPAELHVDVEDLVRRR